MTSTNHETNSMFTHSKMGNHHQQQHHHQSTSKMIVNNDDDNDDDDDVEPLMQLCTHMETMFTINDQVKDQTNGSTRNCPLQMDNVNDSVAADVAVDGIVDQNK